MAEVLAAHNTWLLPAHLEQGGAKGRLLATAVDLFSARGYHGVSVRDITSQMGVQPSSLYAQFASKADLFSEIVFLANDEIRTRSRAVLLNSQPDPKIQLRDLVRDYVEFHATYPLLATIGHNDLNVLAGPALERVAASRKDAVDMMRAVILRGNEAQVFDCPDPWVAVAAIAGMGIRVSTWYIPPGREVTQAEGFADQVRSWMGPDRSIENIKDTISDYALRIVGAR